MPDYTAISVEHPQRDAGSRNVLGLKDKQQPDNSAAGYRKHALAKISKPTSEMKRPSRQNNRERGNGTTVNSTSATMQLIPVM